MIKMIVLDVDGTLTSGGLGYSDTGVETKFFNVKDGLGIVGAVKQGYKVIIITGRKSDVVEKRAKELGITEIYQGISNKVQLLKELSEKYGVSNEEIAYMGDDLNDYSAMEFSGFTGAPSDAVDEIIELVDFISSKKGGEGAVREFIEKIMKEDKTWELVVKKYKNIGGTN